MRKPRLTMDGFMEAQDFDRTRGNAIGASDRSMIDAQRDIILGLEARVAELEAGVDLAAKNERERIIELLTIGDTDVWLCILSRGEFCALGAKRARAALTPK